MKRKIGKIAVPLLVLMLIAATIVFVIYNTAQAVPVGIENTKLGAFTGPEAGTAQDDNVKASLDIVHDYRSKVAKKAQTSVKSTTPDLFDVSGGAILIKNFYGVITTTIGATPTTMQINFDADTGFTDYGFSTAVAITSDSAGHRICFTDANPSVLTPIAGSAAGASTLMSGWFCGEGMIEGTASTADNDGAITWYMEYVPLETGVTVTAQ
jgi:hypothetical protein